MKYFRHKIFSIYGNLLQQILLLYITSCNLTLRGAGSIVPAADVLVSVDALCRLEITIALVCDAIVAAEGVVLLSARKPRTPAEELPWISVLCPGPRTVAPEVTVHPLTSNCKIVQEFNTPNPLICKINKY